MKPPKKPRSNKGKISMSLDILEVLKKDDLEKLSEDQTNELLEMRKRRKKNS